MRQRRFFPLAFFAVVFLGLAALEGFACTCMTQRMSEGKNFQPCGALSYSDVVFVGTVTNIAIQGRGKSSPSGYMIATFSVQKVIRGVNQRTVQVGTNASTAMCGYPFRKGEKYLVYVRRDPDGRLKESLCGQTTLLKDAKADLDYLKAVEIGKERGRAYGTVLQWLKGAPDGRIYQKRDGMRVRLSDPKANRQFEAKTDEDGFYLFSGIPEGKYTVDVELPPGSRLLNPIEKPPFDIVIDYRRKMYCGRVYFTYSTQVE
jgi:hypothetical protein